MSTLVSTTCDAFLNVLAECMDLSFTGGEWFGLVSLAQGGVEALL